MDARAPSILIAGVLFVAACAPSVGSDESTTSRPAGTTATNLREPSQACSDGPHASLNPAARNEQSIVADVDGDGFDDTVTGYLMGAADPAEATAAVLHVELATGWGTELQVHELGLGQGPATVEPRVVVTMDDDRLVVARVAGVSAGELFAFFVFQDCGLRVVSTESGVVPDLWVGGGPTHDDWFVCESDRVTMVQFGTSNPDADPRVYGAGATQTYEYGEGVFTQVMSSEVDGALPATHDVVTGIYPPCLG